MLSSCATVFKGYNSSVDIINAPEDLNVVTSEGVRIPIQQKRERVEVRDSVTGTVTWIGGKPTGTLTIQLRSNKDYVLVLQSSQMEKRVEISPKTSPWWFIIDILLGGIPAIFDGYTGNWNYFEPIDFRSASETVRTDSK